MAQLRRAHVARKLATLAAAHAGVSAPRRSPRTAGGRRARSTPRRDRRSGSRGLSGVAEGQHGRDLLALVVAERPRAAPRRRRRRSGTSRCHRWRPRASCSGRRGRRRRPSGPCRRRRSPRRARRRARCRARRRTAPPCCTSAGSRSDDEAPRLAVLRAAGDAARLEDAPLGVRLDRPLVIGADLALADDGQVGVHGRSLPAAPARSRLRSAAMDAHSPQVEIRPARAAATSRPCSTPRELFDGAPDPRRDAPLPSTGQPPSADRLRHRATARSASSPASRRRIPTRARRCSSTSSASRRACAAGASARALVARARGLARKPRLLRHVDRHRARQRRRPRDLRAAAARRRTRRTSSSTGTSAQRTRLRRAAARRCA